MQRADIRISENYCLRSFKPKPLWKMGGKVWARTDLRCLTGLGGIDLEALRAKGVLAHGLLDRAKLQKNFGLLQGIVLRETFGLNDEARSEFINSHKNQVMQIAAARLGREEDVLDATVNAQAIYQVFLCFKDGDFGAIRRLTEKQRLEGMDPFIDKLMIFFGALPWGKINQRTGKPFKKYSVQVWGGKLENILQYPLVVLDIPDKSLRSACANSVEKLKTMVELASLRQNDPELYAFSDGQIAQIAGSPERKALILKKLQEYAILPKNLRPPLSHIVKISLSADPEKRFNFLDGEIAKKPETISSMVVLASYRDFQDRLEEYRQLLKDGKVIGLKSATVTAMLQAGISVADMKAMVEQGKDIDLSAASAVIMLRAGKTVADVRSTIEQGKDIHLTVSSSVAMLQAGKTVADVRSTIEQGKDIHLTVSSSVAMLQAGISVADVRSTIEQGKDIHLTVSSYVEMLRAGISAADVKAMVEQGKDIHLSASSSVKMLRAGKTVADVRSTIEQGKAIHLTVSSSVKMLRAGISVADMKAMVEQGKDIDLSAASAVIMLRAGKTVADVRSTIEQGKDIHLTVSSSVAMLQAGKTVADVRSTIEQGKDIKLTAASAVRMLRSGILIADVRSTIEQGKELNLSVSSAVAMLQAGKTVADVRSTIEQGKDIHLTVSSSVAMLQAGISAADVKAMVEQGKDIDLSAASVVRMLRAGISVADVKAMVEQGKDIDLSAASAVTMLRSGILIADVRSTIEQGKDIHLTVSSSVAMLQAGISVADVKAMVEQGKDIKLTAVSSVTMLRSGILIADVRSTIEQEKDINLSVSSAVAMLQAGINLEDLRMFSNKIGSKQGAYRMICLLRRGNPNALMPKIFNYLDQLKDLRVKYNGEMEKENIIPGYLLEVALQLEALDPARFTFAGLYQEIENRMLVDGESSKKLLADLYFPLYVKTTSEVLGIKLLIFGRKHFSYKEVYVAAYLTDPISNGKTLEDRLADNSLLSLPDIVILKEVIERAQEILAPDEYTELIDCLSEHEEGEALPLNIQNMIARLTDALSENEEEED